MRIGFDAKRAFLNKSGLGSYSRNLIEALCSNYPDTRFFLYTTRINPGLFNPPGSNIQIHQPGSFLHRKMPSVWRSYSLSRQLIQDKIDLYHGLSHEIPYRFPSRSIKSVVTIHDLIFLRFPHLYSPLDRSVYRSKFRHACQKADRIIAISRQTASDISEWFGIAPGKIEVIYQGCHPSFYKSMSPELREQIRTRYKLPSSFLLYVGTIEERKNLLSLVRAMHQGNIPLPLVVIGKPTAYAQKIRRYLEQHRHVKASFYNEVLNSDLPGFYQLASAFVYPSVYEGFGIPILESLASGTPVITSRGGCFAEAGGTAAVYVDPMNTLELAEAISQVLQDSVLRNRMVEDGYRHARGFDANTVASHVMRVYQQVLNHAGSC